MVEAVSELSPEGEPSSPRVCDYEGSPYRRVFWEESDRSYEDTAERLAVRAMLPRSGHRLLDIGAGFGRMVDEYGAYEQVILLDYAMSMLADARRLHDDRCLYVCADLYRMPFATGTLDTVVQVRVLHHVEHVGSAFAEVARSLRPGGTYLLEFANKRHLKAVARWLIRRQTESPFSRHPHEFVSLNWDFHPDFIESGLRQVDLVVEERRAVSLFRVPALKRHLSPDLLARVDFALGGPLGGLAPAPSQFVSSLRREGGPVGEGLWRCPSCGTEPLFEEATFVPCPGCGRRWPIRDGVYVFREGAGEDKG